MSQTELPDVSGAVQCRLLEWQPWTSPNHNLIGYATVLLLGWITIPRVPVFLDRETCVLQIGLPRVPHLSGGTIRTDRNGKAIYSDAIAFATREGRHRWQRAVTAALEAGGITAAIADQRYGEAVH